MKLKPLVLAAALIVAGGAASAGVTSATAPGGLSSVSWAALAAAGQHTLTATGAFTDTWTFTTDETLIDVSFSAVSSYSQYPSSGFIDILKGDISGGSISGTQAMSGPTYSCVVAGCQGFQHLDYSFASLDAGTYTMVITGDANSTFTSYGTSVTAAVPEPETFALMLAGLGVIGFVAARRKVG